MGKPNLSLPGKFSPLRRRAVVPFRRGLLSYQQRKNPPAKLGPSTGQLSREHGGSLIDLDARDRVGRAALVLGRRRYGEAAQTTLDQAHQVVVARGRVLLGARLLLQLPLLRGQVDATALRVLPYQLLQLGQLPLGRCLHDLIVLHWYAVLVHCGLVGLHFRVTLDDEIHRPTDGLSRLLVVREDRVGGKTRYGRGSRRDRR